MLEAIMKVEGYLKNVAKEAFLCEPMRQDAVIRQLEIIGEAAAKISKDFLNKYPNFPIRESVGMRNFLIHGYDQVDVNVVWKTLQSDIPLLKSKIIEILPSL